MLELRRLRLLAELHERGTIAAVADALRFTPSAVSQQLGLLEREAGVALLERAGRGVRLTDAGLVLAEHARDLLDRAALAEAELAAAAGTVTGRGRIAAFQSVAMRIALPAMAALAQDAPGVRCELVEAEPEDALPALARGDVDVVLADEWQHQPLPMPHGVAREELLDDEVRIVLPAGHRAARARRRATEIASLRDEAWVSGHPGLGWEVMTQHTCRALGAFDPDVRHRANDATVGLALVAGGHAVTLLPDLALAGRDEGVVTRAIAEGPVTRRILAATRSADAARPSTRALLHAIRGAAGALVERAPAVVRAPRARRSAAGGP